MFTEAPMWRLDRNQALELVFNWVGELKVHKLYVPIYIRHAPICRWHNVIIKRLVFLYGLASM